jgi:hypothetical protein
VSVALAVEVVRRSGGYEEAKSRMPTTHQDNCAAVSTEEHPRRRVEATEQSVCVFRRVEATEQQLSVLQQNNDLRALLRRKDTWSWRLEEPEPSLLLRGLAAESNWWSQGRSLSRPCLSCCPE